MFWLSVMSPKNEHDESANFYKSKFLLKKEFKFIFKNFSTFNWFFIDVFLQYYFSSTSNCVNVLSESDDLLIRELSSKSIF